MGQSELLKNQSSTEKKEGWLRFMLARLSPQIFAEH